jgi:cellulose synthase/poly-beta-1,6-N-acetylglucosamine synthase-like glycosyltransferase
VLVEALRAFLIAATVFLAAFYIVTACFAFRQPKPRRHSDIIPHMVSVIIPAHNEEGVIPSLLRDLKNPSFPIAETIVIDDHSKDSTYEVAKRMSATTIRNEVILGKAASINKAAKIATEDILVVFDADNRPDKNCIKYLLKRFDSQDVAIVTGVTKIHSEGLVSSLAALEFSLCFNLFHPFSSRFNFFPILHGAFFGIRRELTSFNEEAVTEDFDYSVSIGSKGYRMVFEPKAISYVSAPPSLSLFKKQREKWIRGAVQASLKHKGFSRRVFRHIGFLGLFLTALGYLLPLVWAATLTFILICYVLGEQVLMNTAIFAATVYTVIVFLANRLAKNNARNILTLPILGFFYFFFVVWYFIKAVVLESTGAEAEFDKIPHRSVLVDVG